MWSRVAIVVALGLLVPVERSWHGDRLTIIIAAAWALTLVWVLRPMRSVDETYRRMAAEPRLVWADVGWWAALLTVAGGWQNLFYVYGWSSFGLASVFWSARRTLQVGVGGCIVLVASHAAWRVSGWDPASRGVRVSEWVAPVVGYVVVAGLFAYVRRRFDDLAAAAAAYVGRAGIAIAATRAAAIAAEREEVAYRLHARIRQVFPALALRVAALQSDVAQDSRVAATLVAISDLAGRADKELDAVVGMLHDASDGTQAMGTSGPGGHPPGFIG